MDTDTPIEDVDVFAQIGEEGFRDLTAAFYKRVKQDDILGPMYPDNDWEGAEERLRDFLVFRFGGPRRYLEKRGHPRMRRRHMPYVLNSKSRDRWLLLMGEAFEETDIPPPIKQHLFAFFTKVAHFLQNHPD